MYLLGIDLGSSSVKTSLIDSSKGKVIASSSHPEREMQIMSPEQGFAEQDPDTWYYHLKMALSLLMSKSGVDKDDIIAAGIAYQMHGLVLVDKDMKVLRPSIIWCDSRAVTTGNKAFEEIGKKKCLKQLYNSPGNFTASKLKWVKDNEPGIYEMIRYIMLPGDFLAMRLTGNINTTITGLSEAVLWDFVNGKPAESVMDYYGIPEDIIPGIVPVFSNQGNISKDVAVDLGLSKKTIVAYRAGDQPNNAFSLNVLNPGQAAATAGTSGVIYGVSESVKPDDRTRVNTFAHVNYSIENPVLGTLLCVNGTGILYSWLRSNYGGDISYDEMNVLAGKIDPGSNGLQIYPFGNGAERILDNRNTGARITNLDFNIHNRSHMFRAAQEGIVYAMNYGLQVMKDMGIEASTINAGNANLFLSPLFRSLLADVTGSEIRLYDTDGAKGAALGAGYGAGIYKNISELPAGLKVLDKAAPDPASAKIYREKYAKWLEGLNIIHGSL
ncbi:MAG: carbohydrate kinase [Bacteroidales bacterium]|nr:carbohydrate kinase [Bacteroidales bacterium]